MLLTVFICTNGTFYMSVFPGRGHTANEELVAFIALLNLDTMRVCSHWHCDHTEVPPPRTSRGVSVWSQGTQDSLMTKASNTCVGHKWRARMGWTGWTDRYAGLHW